MNITHYSDHSAELAAELVNSLGATSGNDALDSPRALAEFLARHAEPWAGFIPAPSDRDLEGVKDLRELLRGVFEADDETRAAAIINSILAENAATPRVASHGDHLDLHFEPSGAGLVQWLGVVTGMGLAMSVADEGLSRLGVCASDTCDDVYIDTSRNRSRRHCTTTCSTRENVAAYRRRQRGGPESGSTGAT